VKPAPDRRRPFLLAALASAVLAVCWTAATASGRFAPLDQNVFDAIARLRTAAGTSLMMAVSYLGSEYLTPVLLLGAGLAIGRRSAKWGWFIAITVISANVWQIALKHWLAISRPPPLFPYWQKAGYPSGHAMVGLCFSWGILLYLRSQYPGWPRRWWERAAAAVLAAWPLAVGFSRVYLAAHWMSDIVGGLLLGVMHFTAAWGLYGRELEGEALR